MLNKIKRVVLHPATPVIIDAFCGLAWIVILVCVVLQDAGR